MPAMGIKSRSNPLFWCASGAGRQPDRAGFNGAFSEDEALRLDQAFPLMLKELELRLHSGEVNPCSQHWVTLHYNGLTC